MVAFTHLCNKVNISLVNNTLTLYPKYDEPLETHLGKNEDSLINMGLRYIHQDDEGHDLLHQDLFSREHMHVHMEFIDEINDISLESILNFFVDIKILNKFEAQNFITAYKAADDWENQPVFNYYRGEDDPLLSILQAIKMRSIALEKENAGELAVTAKILYSDLSSHFDCYAKNRNASGYERFKTNCNNVIEKYSPILGEDNDLKQLLQNTTKTVNSLESQYKTAAPARSNWRSRTKFSFFQTDLTANTRNTEVSPARKSGPEN